MNLKGRKKFSIFITNLLIFMLAVGAETNSLVQQNVDVGENKEIFLTFDDGPTPGVTEKLLDVLKENNTKATFFVVGKEIVGREDILRRIHSEGHSIGLHSYSHDFSSIYRSDEAFINELDRSAKLIKEVTGYKATCVRFPGGSDKMLTQKLLDKLHSKGYKVFDWNSNLQDGEKPNLSVESFLRNSRRVKGNKNRIFVLAHNNSNNKNTYKALSTIIEYYRGEGFEFKAIKEDTEEYYYKFKKGISKH